MAYSRAVFLFGCIVALIAVQVVLADTDYYAVLGLKKGANEQEIKRAYRKLSLQFHPDKNPGNKEAEKRMQEITNAHDILGDPEKKKIYDQHGEEGLKQHQANGGRQQNPFDIFSMFGFGGGGQNQEARTPDVTLPLHVTLKDLYLGRVTEVHYVRHVLCERHADCTTTNGCSDCSGPGQRVVISLTPRRPPPHPLISLTPPPRSASCYAPARPRICSAHGAGGSQVHFASK